MKLFNRLKFENVLDDKICLDLLPGLPLGCINYSPIIWIETKGLEIINWSKNFGLTVLIVKGIDFFL